MMDVWYVFVAFASNLFIGYVAFHKKALKYPSGFIAAAIVGITIFMASWRVWVVLATFFITSSLLSKFRENDPLKKKAMAFAEKGSQRDHIQVFANGGGAFIFSCLGILAMGIDIQNTPPIILGAVASLAASTSDTWSTEIGTSSPTPPVLIYRPWEKVPRGTSGGVTLLGTVASFFGAFLISCVFFLLDAFSIENALVILIAGFAGGFVDSILGGTIQATFSCSVCNKKTERLVHCNSPTVHIGGIRWFNNDAVNFVASFSAGLLAWFLASILPI